MKVSLKELNFVFNPNQTYDDNVYRLLVALPLGTYIEVAELTNDKTKLIKSVKENIAIMALRNIEIDSFPCLCIRKAKNLAFPNLFDNS
jgi:hypothetical protein